MADREGGGSGFMGLIAGLLIAAILIVGGFYIYNNGGLGQRTAEINVNVPSAPVANEGGG